MKKSAYYIVLLTGIIMISCNTNKAKTDKQSDKKASEWFNQSVWSTSLSIAPDESIDLQLFKKHHDSDPQTWKAAHDFLNRKDLTELSVGRYELTDNGMYATVSVYDTKDPEEALYEAHRKFIDIQYVAEGVEHIEILPLSKIDEKAEYDEEKDIIFFTTKIAGDKRLADKRRYFVFFPEDAHKPCLKTDTKGTVKKVVIKIPIGKLY